MLTSLGDLPYFVLVQKSSFLVAGNLEGVRSNFCGTKLLTFGDLFLEFASLNMFGSISLLKLRWHKLFFKEVVPYSEQDV